MKVNKKIIICLLEKLLAVVYLRIEELTMGKKEKSCRYWSSNVELGFLYAICREKCLL